MHNSIILYHFIRYFAHFPLTYKLLCLKSPSVNSDLSDGNKLRGVVRKRQKASSPLGGQSDKTFQGPLSLQQLRMRTAPRRKDRTESHLSSIFFSFRGGSVIKIGAGASEGEREGRELLYTGHVAFEPPNINCVRVELQASTSFNGESSLH